MKKLDLTKIILACAMILGFTFQSNAQSADRQWALGAYGSILEFHGDIGTEFFTFDFKEVEVRGGISLAKYLNPSFDLMGRITVGELNHEGECRFYKYTFDATYVSSNINLVYKFNNGYILPEDFIVAPYLTAGLGGFYYSTEGKRMKDGVWDYYGEAKKVLTPGDLYGGIGFKIRATKSLGVVVQSGLHYALSDRLDGAIDMENAYDRILEHSLGLTYSIANAADTDADGIPDTRDRCPDTPEGAKVDKYGCAMDTDGDGVADFEDECPYEPGLIRFNGCPDSDNDGVRDADDECPDLAGAKKFKGCPDTDGDAIEDRDDECPDMVGPLELNGCPCDYKPTEFCGDDDGDGVSNSKDKCPDTKPGVKVDEDGCEMDTDGDGIPDSADNCPDVAGSIATNGCPELDASVLAKKLLDAAETVKFDTNKATLRSKSEETLDVVAKIMTENKQYHIKLSGYTDNVGPEGYNKALSQKRAQSCKEYLVSKGIGADRISAEGFGEANPIATNSTAEGKQLNRRTEFKLFIP